MPSKLQKTTAWLRRNYPTRTPLVVRVSKTLDRDCHGVCCIGDGRALIRIASAAESVMLDTLLEEYCHVLRHDTPIPIHDDHDAIFWAILGQVTKHWRGE